jgi:hypothetical protein
MMKAVVVAPGEGRFIAVGSAGTGVTVKASCACSLRCWSISATKRRACFRLSARVLE